MLWPFENPPIFPDFEKLQQPSRPAFVVFKNPHNEPGLVEIVERAMETASQKKATILVFPELSFTPYMLERAQQILAANGVGGYPILTVAGLCHAPLSAEGDIHVNEAVLLGPDGRELHRHRKLTCFTVAEGEDVCSERTHIGDTLRIIETAVGNLALLICLDFFAEHCERRVRASHANLLVVPSLSPKTSAHETAAQRYIASQLATTFVSNQTLPGGDPEKAESFCMIPRKKNPLVRHDPQDVPYLLVSLEP
jgi:predicted amidohydrolase